MEAALSAQARRTRKLIRQALLALLEDHGFESITLSMVAERAEVNRSTVYRYYESLMDILGDCIYEVSGMADEHVPPHGAPDFDDRLERVIACSYRDMRDHASLYLLIRRFPQDTPSGSPHVGVVEAHSRKFYRNLVDQLVALRPGIAGSHAYLETTLSGISGALAKNWIDGGFVEEPEELARVTMSFFSACIDAADGASDR